MSEQNYSDEDWMQLAYAQAALAAAQGEIPVGAVIVSQNQVIGAGYNALFPYTTQPHMPKLWQSVQHVIIFKIIVYLKMPRFMSHWSLVPCVWVRSFMRESNVWYLEQLNPKPAH